MKNFFLLFLTIFIVFACGSNASNKPEKKDGILSYFKTDFGQGKSGFYPSKRVELSLVDDAISGKALQAICKEKWAGPALKLDISGSKGLKIAFMAKGLNFKRATFNLFDKKANDNTTPYGYRFLPDNEWTPVLYFVDRFRYNSKRRGFIKPETHFTTLRFWGPEPQGKEVILTLDNFVIYRGEDKSPPKQVRGLKAEATPAGIKISWQPAEDNAFPMVYVISRAEEKGPFVKIAESYHPWYLDQNVKPDTVYRYRILAGDFQNNLGPWSEIVPIKYTYDPPKISKKENIWEQDRRNYSNHIREVFERGRGKVRKGYVCLYGDSLTHATLYRHYVAGALGIYRVKARGFPGKTIEWGLANVDLILQQENPQFLLVLFGTNNVRGRLRKPEVYEKWVEKLIRLARKAEERGTIVILGTIPPRGFKDPLSLPEALFNEVLVRRAREAKIPVAYIFEGIQEAGDRRQFIWKDGVHWTAKGMEVAAWAWRKTMRQVEFAIRYKPDPPQLEISKSKTQEVSKQILVKGPWPPPGERQKVEITKDTFVSHIKEEKFGNNGKVKKLKLKGQQEFSLVDADFSRLRGKLVTGALLHFKVEDPVSAPLGRVGVSTISSPWEEGTARRPYQKIKGAACFAQAAYKERDWAYPGSNILDVIFGRGHTIWRFADATPPDKLGWQAVPVDPDVIAANVAGLSHGLAIFDEVGNEWGCNENGFYYRYFPNRFLASREKKGQSPWLEIWVAGEDHEPPAPVENVRITTDLLPPGEALLSWKTPSDKGGGKTLGFDVFWRRKGGHWKPLPRYLIPLAGKPGEEVKLYLHDLGLRPGEIIDLKIVPVDNAGNRGPEKEIEVALSDTPFEFPLAFEEPPLPTDKESSTLVKDDEIEIFIIDPFDKVDPITGTIIPKHPSGYLFNNHIFSAEKNIIRLYSAKNELVHFQIVVKGRLENAKINVNFPELIRTKLYEFAYVQKGKKYFPDPLIPIEGGFFSIPAKSGKVFIPEQKYHALIVEIYVPHEAPSGLQRGELSLVLQDKVFRIPISLRIWNFTLPDKLSFIPEMNAYGRVDPRKGYAYYRLAHYHRTCLNRLPYNWAGHPAFAPRWNGKGFDWSSWDRYVSPLLDGSAFADLPRKNQPVDVFYLPFNENWPVPLPPHFKFSYWAEEAFDKAYKEELSRAFAAFAKHCNEKGWHNTLFQFFLNNKVYYRKERHCVAPWLFDEPMNTQDFWALRWYGLLWHKAVDPVAGKAKMWFRVDVSYSEFSRDLFRGVVDIEYVGGNNEHKTKMKNIENVLWGKRYFFEYGSANRIEDSNFGNILWCLRAWWRGADGVLPWQTIGSKNSWKKADNLALFYPGKKGPFPSIRLKSFTRGQQDVEYLTLLYKTYGIPRWQLANTVEELLRNPEDKILTLWKLRMSVAQMLDKKSPPYKEALITWTKPATGANFIPVLSKPLFYPVGSSPLRPVCDSFQ